MTIAETIQRLDADEITRVTAREVFELLHRLLKGGYLRHLSREHLPALSRQYGELQDLIGMVRGEMGSGPPKYEIVERELTQEELADLAGTIRREVGIVWPD